MQISVSLYLDTRRASTKHHGKYPCKVRVTFRISQTRWVQRYYPTKQYFSVKEFDRILKPKTAEDQKTRAILAELEQRAWTIASVKNITPERFDALFTSSTITETSTVNYHFHRMMADLRHHGRPESTVSLYLLALHSLEAYHQERYHQTKIYLQEVTKDYLKAYEAHMLAKGNTLNTIGIYLRNLRAVFNAAMPDYCPPDCYPFGRKGYVIRSQVNFKVPLTETQLQALKQYQPQSPAEQRALDFFFFSYYCNGMNVADILALCRRNLLDDFLVYNRNKTTANKTRVRPIYIPLRAEITNIIVKYGQPNLAPDAYLFPFYHPQHTAAQRYQVRHQFRKSTNHHLKAIAERAGIKKLTVGLARHTFANRMLNVGTDKAMIQYLLGHTDLKTTEHYVGSFALDKIKKAAENL